MRQRFEEEKPKVPTQAEIDFEISEVERLVSEGRLEYDITTDGKPAYHVPGLTLTNRTDALKLVERLEKIQDFDRLMRLMFTNGMVEGITTYKKQLAGLGPMYDKALLIGRQLLNLIAARS